jgi:hypothetical protein
VKGVAGKNAVRREMNASLSPSNRSAAASSPRERMAKSTPPSFNELLSCRSVADDISATATSLSCRSKTSNARRCMRDTTCAWRSSDGCIVCCSTLGVGLALYVCTFTVCIQK